MFVIRILTVMFLILSGSVSAQNTNADGRVKEVESFLSKKSLDFIRGRFPGVPVLVSVKIEPLRMTNTGSSSGLPENNLPYLGFGSEQQIDPWDDDSVSVHDLLSRVRYIEAKITLPNTIEDDLIFEVREALFSNLGMIKGRDRIEFTRKNWPGQTELVIEYFVFAGVAAVLVLLGLFLIARQTFSTLSSTIKAAAAEKSGGGSAGAMAAPVNIEPKREEKKSQNIQLNDSMKVAEKLESLIWKLSDDPGFPTLEDMIELEKVAINNPHMLGGILNEMPQDMRDKIFQRGKDTAWLEAFFSNGELGLEAYQFILNLTRKSRDESKAEWEDLLISLWRLGPELTGFMRGLEQRDALGIFAWMPIEISLPAATEAFPGAWGILLKHDFKPPVLPDDLATKMREKALEIKPLNDPKMLERYDHERGLIKYLKTCPLETEKDVYKAAKEGGALRMVRPPFFEVLEAREEILKELVPKMPIQDWGIALFNIDRGTRSAITDHLNDREKFVLIETLKECDRTRISNEEVGDVREKIAREFSKFMANFKGTESDFDGDQVEDNDQSSDSQGNAA